MLLCTTSVLNVEVQHGGGLIAQFGPENRCRRPLRFCGCFTVAARSAATVEPICQCFKLMSADGSIELKHNRRLTPPCSAQRTSWLFQRTASCQVYHVTSCRDDEVTIYDLDQVSKTIQIFLLVASRLALSCRMVMHESRPVTLSLDAFRA